MKRHALFSLAILLVSAHGLLAEPKPIAWSDLSPPVEEIENPFAAMSAEHMDMLRALLRIEKMGVDDADAREEAHALRLRLAQDGLDAEALFAARDEIIAHRRRAAEEVNADLIGLEVRLPGYLLPLEIRDRKAVEFLLVPTIGACIHTPPPPANQMVYVRYPDGFAVDDLYTPVWINGSLAAESSVQTVGYVDGQSRVSVSYAMSPGLVEPYRPTVSGRTRP